MKVNVSIILPVLQSGGAERIVSDLSLFLSSNEFNKNIILFDGEKIDYPYEGNLIDCNIKATINPFGKIANLFRRINKVKKIKKKLHIKISISFLDAAHIVNLFSRTEDKVILSIRNFKSKSLKGFYGIFYYYFIKVFYNKSDQIVAVSEGVKNDLTDKFKINKDKIVVINNFYDLEKIKKLSKEAIEDRYNHIFNSPVIINIGRLTEQKGQWHLIRAFSRAKEEIDDLKLVILGDGEMENYLKQLVSGLKLEGEVFFLGFQKNPFKFISKSEIFILSSLYEGFPNVLVEAMACGIPVVSTDCKSGPREILSLNTSKKYDIKTVEWADYGVLVPVCDGEYYKANDALRIEEHILAECIIDLYQNREVYAKYRDKAIKRAEYFKTERTILQYEKLLKKVVSQ